MSELDIYTDETTVARKTKLRAYAITIDNTFGKQPSLIYHEEKVFLEIENAGQPNEKTRVLKSERVGEMRAGAGKVLPTTHTLSTGATVSGAEVAEWLMRDYVARKAKAE